MVMYTIRQVVQLLSAYGLTLSYRRVSQYCKKVDAQIVRLPRPQYRLTEEQVMGLIQRAGKRGRPALSKD